MTARQCEMENEWAQQCQNDARPGADYCTAHAEGEQ